MVADSSAGRAGLNTFFIIVIIFHKFLNKCQVGWLNRVLSHLKKSCPEINGYINYKKCQQNRKYLLKLV